MRPSPSRTSALLRALLPFLLVTSAGAGKLLAQDATTAVLTGRVTDPAHAAVAGAQIHAVRSGAGLRREAVTNARGEFRIGSLPPGEYAVTADAAGFATRSFPKVTVSVGQSLDLVVHLDVAGVKEAVTVSETAPIATSSSVVDGVIGTEAIDSLPLNGRNFLELAFLIPGNAPAPNFDPTKTNSIAVSSAGQLGRGGNVTIDGQDNNDDAVGGPLTNVPEDAVQEFQIATNRFSAELGRSGSSVINVVTKSGSDEVHGSTSFFWRDDALQALPATYNRASGPAPPFDREQYAASLGGPLVKGKAYWFGAVEYRNQDAVAQVGTRDLATHSIINGFAPAPLTDFMATARVDAQASDRNRLTLRYAYEDAKDTGASTLDRAIGSASQRQTSQNRYHSVLGSWTSVLSPASTNTLRASFSDYKNDIEPVTPGPQLNFPSLQDGASFRVPQGTAQRRWQASDTFSWTHGSHAFRFGAEAQKVEGAFFLGVFRQGEVALVQDFPAFDLNRDGKVDDNDLLFAVTIRSGKPNQDLNLDNCNNTHLAGFAQDDWRITPQLTLNLGLRYEIDSDVKNLSGYGDINPIVKPFLVGDRNRDSNNWAPRVGFNWTSPGERFQIHGGYGIYYDRVTLEIESLERGLDGRALPIEVRAGNVQFLDPTTGALAPGAPTFSNPFTGFILPGAGASGINIIDNRLQNPSVQQSNLGTQVRLADRTRLSVDYLHDLGTHFIIGRPIGTVFNPVVGGPDTVVNLESSVNTRYDGLLVSLETHFSRHVLRAAYTLSRARNYANDDQIPFSSGPIDPNDLSKEYGPTPNEQRHRFVLSGLLDLPLGVRVAPIWTLASGVPMDILMPDGSTRVPTLPRNAGGREFTTGAQLNAYITQLNASGGINGVLLPLVSNDARFNDSFDSLDLRLSRPFKIGRRASLEALVECFNVFNVTNILGTSKSNYSGFANALVRDSDDPTSPGYLHSSSFGRPLTTAGGVFGSGGPRAFQLGVRLVF